MGSFDGGSKTARWRLAIFCAAAAALIVKFELAIHTYGTNDAYWQEQYGVWAGQLGGHVYDFAYNHPASWLHVLRLLAWLAPATGQSFPFWLRFLGILADTGSFWLVWKLFGDR